MSNKLLNSWENEVSRLAVDEIGRSVIGMDVEGVMISDELEERVSLCISEERRLVYRHSIRNKIAVILIAAILLILSACTTMAIIQYKPDKYVIKQYDGHYTITVRKPKPFSVMKEEDFVKKAPSYVPEGYRAFVDGSGSVVTVYEYYYNKMDGYEGYISYSQYRMCQSAVMINTESSELIRVEINGHEGIAVLQEGDESEYDSTYLYWTDGEYDYKIFTYFPLEEAIKIAESIE